MANRIRNSLKNMDTALKQLSTSIGMAIVLAAHARRDDIFQLAHDAMLSARGSGRNQIEIEAFCGG